ncbi:MAG TPA: ABC transporter substrate-binding protein [Gaiellaceae bacterium]|nr:ABC transporter substrate-binding protein [Gaiellaceae bacterium]
MRRVSLAGLAVLGALALAIPAAFAKADATAATPGVTSKSIVIGGTFPLTGPASSYAPIPAGMKAYFSYVNSRRGPDGKRGVYGRQIVFKFYDDGYNPVNSVQLTRKLVQEDKVFAVVGSLGTEVNEAIRPYLNEARVPHVLVSTGATQFSSKEDAKRHPWTMGWQPDYIAEGRLYGLDVSRNRPNAKIAILFQNDSYGKDYVYGFKSALGRAKVQRQVVAEEAYEVTQPSPQSQLVKLRASGADTLLIFVTPRPTIQTYAIIRALGWKPNIYVNSVSATDTFMTTAVRSSSADTVNGSISAAYLKDPANPQWANDRIVKQYKALMAKYNPNGNPNDSLNFYGFAKADTFVRALYKAGRNPTRASLMRAMLSFDETTPYLLPSVRLKTSATDRFMISQQQMQVYNNGTWRLSGRLVDLRPRG